MLDITNVKYVSGLLKVLQDTPHRQPVDMTNLQTDTRHD